jgi:hypothetical protein
MFFILPPAGRPPHAGDAAVHMPSEVETNKGKSSSGGRAGRGETISTASETTGERLNVLQCQRQVAWLPLSHLEFLCFVRIIKERE